MEKLWSGKPFSSERSEVSPVGDALMSTEQLIERVVRPDCLCRNVRKSLVCAGFILLLSKKRRSRSDRG
jgi:hypothetical protein